MMFKLIIGHDSFKNFLSSISKLDCGEYIKIYANENIGILKFDDSIPMQRIPDICEKEIDIIKDECMLVKINRDTLIVLSKHNRANGVTFRMMEVLAKHRVMCHKRESIELTDFSMLQYSKLKLN